MTKVYNTQEDIASGKLISRTLNYFILSNPLFSKNFCLQKFKQVYNFKIKISYFGGWMGGWYSSYIVNCTDLSSIIL